MCFAHVSRYISDTERKDEHLNICVYNLGKVEAILVLN
jgi:hypothetical protein